MHEAFIKRQVEQATQHAYWMGAAFGMTTGAVLGLLVGAVLSLPLFGLVSAALLGVKVKRTLDPVRARLRLRSERREFLGEHTVRRALPAPGFGEPLALTEGDEPADEPADET